MIKQVGINKLREAVHSVLNGGDPLEFVNAFFKQPANAPDFPQEYWQRRVCAVAELLAEAGKAQHEQT